MHIKIEKRRNRDRDRDRKQRERETYRERQRQRQRGFKGPYAIFNNTCNIPLINLRKRLRKLPCMSKAKNCHSI